MTAVSTIQPPAIEPDTRAWISTGFSRALSAKYYDNVEQVVVNDTAHDFSIHMPPAVAANLALALLRAASLGGFDVGEHLRSAAVELTDSKALAYELLDDAGAVEGLGS